MNYANCVHSSCDTWESNYRASPPLISSAVLGWNKHRTDQAYSCPRERRFSLYLFGETLSIKCIEHHGTVVSRGVQAVVSIGPLVAKGSHFAQRCNVVSFRACWSYMPRVLSINSAACSGVKLSPLLVRNLHLSA